jgi:exonuclease VII large subunit
LDEPTLERIFVEAINKILSDREEYIAALQPIIDMISDTYDIDSEALILGERSAGLYARLEALVADNAQRFQDQNEYRAQYAEMEQRYESVKAKLAELEEQKQSRLVRREKILQFIETVHQRETLLTEFDEALFRATVECITVHTVADIRVKFRDGSEVKIDSRQKRYTEQ